MSGGLGVEEFATILDVKLVLGGYGDPKLRSVGSVGKDFGGQWDPLGRHGEAWGSFGDPCGFKYGTLRVPRVKSMKNLGFS